MSYWVAYRMGSFPLKELFESFEMATIRARELFGESYYAQVISVGSKEPHHARLLVDAIEMRPGAISSIPV